MSQPSPLRQAIDRWEREDISNKMADRAAAYDYRSAKAQLAILGHPELLTVEARRIEAREVLREKREASPLVTQIRVARMVREQIDKAITVEVEAIAEDIGAIRGGR